MQSNETVAAISTSIGTAALGIIRITGVGSFEVVAKCVRNKERFLKCENRKILLQMFSDQQTGEIIDEVTIIKYGNPHSFTGEDMVEIICHGGRSIVKRIFDELKKNGVKSAAKGEFSKRAFLNGKIDLMKAEAINSMILSNNDIRRKIATRSYEGGYVKVLKIMNDEISGLLAEIEAEIEFGDEDDVKELDENKNKIIGIKNKIEIELSKRKKIKEIEKGMKIVIAGPANAGKSTLFNKILGYDRSIIYDEPGTTRDIITEKITVSNEEITLTDSAGIRKTENSIEKMGIERSVEEIENAHLTIWISALNEPISNEEKEIVKKLKKNKTITLLNKYDLTENSSKEKFYKEMNLEYIRVSLKEESNTEIIIDKLKNTIEKNVDEMEVTDFVSSYRQEEIAERMLKEIQSAITMWSRKEISAFHLHSALDCIEEFLGKRDREDIYNKIFDTFCIGK